MGVIFGPMMIGLEIGAYILELIMAYVLMTAAAVIHRLQMNLGMFSKTTVSKWKICQITFTQGLVAAVDVHKNEHWAMSIF